MSDIQQTITIAVIVAVAILIVGVCSQGRLKHWILVLLGESQSKIPTPFDEIPRAEHDWSLLSRLRGLDRPDD